MEVEARMSFVSCPPEVFAIGRLFDFYSYFKIAFLLSDTL